MTRNERILLAVLVLGLVPPVLRLTGLAASIDWNLVINFVKAVAWPVVTALGIILYREALIDLVSQIARRARKLSIYEVSVEFGRLEELQPSWSVSNLDVRQLTPSYVFDSYSGTLIEQVSQPESSDYAVVDLDKGDAWLTSRLYIFALVLGEVTRLRAFVFLETSPETRRKFIGIASPEDVRRSLGTRYPWLEDAAGSSFLSVFQPILPGVKFSTLISPFQPVNQDSIRQFVKEFLDAIQAPTPPVGNEAAEYLQIGSAPGMWERTRWIDATLLERDLKTVLQTTSFEDTTGTSIPLDTEGILDQDGALVALVDRQRQFRSLVDRQVLLNRAWQTMRAEKRKTDISPTTTKQTP